MLPRNVKLMKHAYTWSHINLFAKICAKIDNEESVTASWVQTTEEHNKQTFPFTLWPLTYRTCEVTTSPAMCSPVHIASTDSVCDYHVKIIRCNEVVIICIQEGSCGNVCDHPCISDLNGVAYKDVNNNDTESYINHANHHCTSEDESLLPCHAAHCYHQIKDGINDAFFSVQDGTESVICIGHGAGATMASCLAADISQIYEEERGFLGLDSKRVSVDFVGFSDFVVASPAYWNRCSIDSYISISLDVCSTPAKTPALMVRNPRSLRVIINDPPSLSRSVSLFDKLKNINKKNSRQPKDRDRDHDISEYVAALNKKILLPV